jgi:cytochrome c peroxidase
MMKNLKSSKLLITVVMCALAVAASVLSGRAQGEQGRGEQVGGAGTQERQAPGEAERDAEARHGTGHRRDGKRLFERETFGGNGRTCMTCHGSQTGTVSPDDALLRFRMNPGDPLFLHDGSDDGHEGGVTRMLDDATILVEVPLPPNVRLADDPGARTVVVRRGVPSTLNTPALDPVLMWDGREPDLQSQARGAIRGHAQAAEEPGADDLQRIAEFERSKEFFSSDALRSFAAGGPAPALPEGVTESERRGRRFFVDAADPADPKVGSCAACHSGPMLNQTNRFLPLPVPPGARFQDVLVSEFNSAANPVRTFIFTNPDGTETEVNSPDPGRALVTGDPRLFPFDSLNAFKIPSLWGVSRTAPYFHDNSAPTLEDLMAHYAKFFAVVTTPPGGGPPAIALTEQDQADAVAYLKLLE